MDNNQLPWYNVCLAITDNFFLTAAIFLTFPYGSWHLTLFTFFVVFSHLGVFRLIVIR